MSAPPHIPVPKGFEGLAMRYITDPADVDVLCGRGGAALKHPGNQTYRRLVNLNKGLYITCLKTEKLKISRSIVAAIREQKGRFLERDGNKGTWFDIGDKKAIEKTSQALREGQPKLRQKMVELGSGPPGTGLGLEHRFGNGVYHPTGMPNPALTAAYNDPTTYGMQQMLPHPSMQQQAQHMMGQAQQQHAQQQQQHAQQQHAQQQHAQQQHAQQQQQQQQQQAQQQMMNMNEMAPPPTRNMAPEVDSEMMMERLSLSSTPVPPGINANGSAGMKSSMSSGMQNRGPGATHPFGTQQSQSNENGMQDFSAYGNATNMKPMAAQQVASMGQTTSSNSQPAPHSLQPLAAPAAPPPQAPASLDASAVARKMDRRRLFARMKYSRPGSARFSGSNRSLGGGGEDMPDSHMVDSTFSLLSNLSGANGKQQDPNNALPKGSGQAGKIKEEYMVVGSRRSLMSGLSRISDQSDVNSIFSDLSRKIGNVSTRSIAMSEISGIEEGYQEDLDESFKVDPAASAPRMDF
jgi:hypothetical protein